MNDNKDGQTAQVVPCKGRGRLAKSLWLGGLLAALVVAFVMGSVVGPYALASSGHLFGAGGHGCPFGKGRHSALQDPAEAREHARFASEWILRSVGANEEQKERVGAVAEKLADDLLAIVPEHRENRKAFLEALAGTEVDRAALERIRQAEIGLFERASARVVEALTETAGLLTPEQRTTLVKAAERFHH